MSNFWCNMGQIVNFKGFDFCATTVMSMIVVPMVFLLGQLCSLSVTFLRKIMFLVSRMDLQVCTHSSKHYPLSMLSAIQGIF